MSKKQFFAVVDVETTMSQKVADFGMVICDREGVIYSQCAVLIRDIFGVDSLFFNSESGPMWTKASIDRRMGVYNDMLSSGSRMLASVGAVNSWISKAIGKYNPTLTAYNLPFDTSKCANTLIDLNGFSDRFCLWAAASGNICQTKAYKQFVLENHLFNTPTEYRNMTYKTDAESVTGFLSGQLTAEPHTSIEDIIGYEIPTLVHILKKRKWKENMLAYNWRTFQVKSHFKV
jgi:hypothetical protein